MGADIKSLRNRIKSVKSTLHLTKAMGLVASSKIRRAQESRVKSEEYVSSLRSIVNVLSSSRECRMSPYLAKGTEGDRTRVVLIAGDRGLAGGYNVNVFRLARELKEGTEIFAIGKKACERYSQPVRSSEKFTYEDAYELALELCRSLKEGETDKIQLLSTKYVSMITQEPTLTTILPLESDGGEAKGEAVFEPDELTILEGAVPIYVAGLIYEATRESFACEVVARRSAMDSAGKNASAMIDDLQLKYNRARQGAITQEITEIVAGSGE